MNRSGHRVKLQPKSAAVLLALVSKHGSTVSRGELQEALWADGTVVDYDLGLNIAIKKLRDAFGDSAEDPYFVQTTPGEGYRFIAPVERIGEKNPVRSRSVQHEAPVEVVAARPEPKPSERASSAPEKSSRLRRALPWALGVIAPLLAGIAAWLLLKPAPQPEVIRFQVPPPENAEFVAGGGLSLSPDGRALAFITRPDQDKQPTLWVRPLDSLTAQQIPGTADADELSWSPNSRQILFEANGKLEKVALSGGAPEALCDASGAGAAWNRDGVILFSHRNSLFTVPDTGGTPTLVLAPDSSKQEMNLKTPQFLPDGRHFIFQASLSTRKNFLEVGSLDAKGTERLMPTEAQAVYAPPGYLFYTNQGTLLARPFDAKALRFTGPALPLAQRVGRDPLIKYSFFSVSPAGVLAYQAGQYFETSQITLFNRAGERLGTLGQPGRYTTPAMSPDGSKLGVAVGEYGERNLWIYDLRRGTASRLTSDSADDTSTTWSPDGSRILFSSSRDGQYDLDQQPANGLGSAELVFQSKLKSKYIDDISPDGRYILYDTGWDKAELWVLPLFGERKPYPFVQGNFCAKSAMFSPNGRFVAYASDKTGKFEVYVETFPRQTGKWHISTSGGNVPMWRRDGKELFFLSVDGRLMSVAVNTNGTTFEAAVPKPLFQTQLDGSTGGRNFYVVAPDGQRFLMLAPIQPASSAPISVVVNWPALLKK